MGKIPLGHYSCKKCLKKKSHRDLLCLQLLLKACIGAETEMLASQMKDVKTNSAETPLHKVVRAMEAGLSYQFNKNWDIVFRLLSTMFEVGTECCELYTKN